MRPPTRSLVLELERVYELYVRFEWAASEREANLDGLARDELERRIWETSQMRRMALTFFDCFGAFNRTGGEADRPDRVHATEAGAAVFSAYLEQQRAFWSEQLNRGEVRARESTARLAMIADASALFHRLLGYPPEVVRDRARELEFEGTVWFTGMLPWNPERGLELKNPEGPCNTGDAALLKRLAVPAPHADPRQAQHAATTNALVNKHRKGGR